MQLNREEFIRHLKVLHAGSLIPDAVVYDNFKFVCLNEEEAFLVQSNGYGDEDLPQPIGILDVKTLINALNTIEDNVIGFSFEDGRIRVQTENLSYNLLTCDPSHVTTNKDDKYTSSIVEFVDENQVCRASIDKDFVDNLKNVQGIIGSDFVQVNVSPEGSQFVLGSSNENEGSVLLDDMVADEAFTVKLPSRPLITALVMFQNQEIVFTGEESLVAVEANNYRYVISPTE